MAKRSIFSDTFDLRLPCRESECGCIQEYTTSPSQQCCLYCGRHGGNVFLNLGENDFMTILWVSGNFAGYNYLKMMKVKILRSHNLQLHDLKP